LIVGDVFVSISIQLLICLTLDVEAPNMTVRHDIYKMNSPP
jgi:hypothetical protein